MYDLYLYIILHICLLYYAWIPDRAEWQVAETRPRGGGVAPLSGNNPCNLNQSELGA